MLITERKVFVLQYPPCLNNTLINIYLAFAQVVACTDVTGNIINLGQGSKWYGGKERLRIPSKLITKQHIANALKSLAGEKAFSNITVANICSESGINRSTFYYHFDDKYDLQRWIFQHECGADLVKNRPSGFWEFFRRLSDYLYANRNFYAIIFSSRDRPYMEYVLKSFLEKHIGSYFRPNHIAKERKAECLDFICTNFVASLIQWLLYWSDILPEDFIELIRFDKLST